MKAWVWMPVVAGLTGCGVFELNLPQSGDDAQDVVQTDAAAAPDDPLGLADIPMAEGEVAGAPDPAQAEPVGDEEGLTDDGSAAPAAAASTAAVGAGAIPPLPRGRLGETVASLGDPAQAGFWLRTPLVRAPGKGRIVNPGTGQEVRVDLIPLDGPPTAGSQISLAAMQAIGASLTDLPTIEVFAGG